MSPSAHGRDSGACVGFAPGEVPAYYSRKTNDILHKYGPGPRVHYHVGLFGAHETPNTTVAQSVLRRRLHDAQEAMLAQAARDWRVAETPPARLLDIGCGLGGGALYWAGEHGARVTALTIAGEHVPIIAGFVRQAGLGDRVAAVHGDIHQLDAEPIYDAAVAFESSGYMDRGRLFRVVARALRPGAWFGIEEHLPCRPEWTALLDDYYKTRLGSLGEYIGAARAAGFFLEDDEDVTDRVVEFWVQSMAWTEQELDRIAGGGHSPIVRERLRDSALMHGKLFRIWREHAVETRLLLFRLHHG